MIETLAQKRTHLAALAVLAGLVVALFAVFQTASAAPSLVVGSSDSDNVIKAGDRINITAYVKDPADGASYFLDYALASNGVIYTATVAVNAGVDGTAAAPTVLGSLLAPSSAAGEYTVSVRVRNNADAAAATVFLPGEVTVTVGEVGDAISSVEVSLGKVGHGNLPKTATDKDTTSAYGATTPTNYAACADASTADSPDTDVDANCIAITVDVKNSLGNAANNADVSTVHVFAALAVVYVPPDGTAADGANSGEFTAAATTGASTKFFIAKEKPGTVDVYAIAIGPSGSATSATLTLSFTGTADTLVLGDPSGPLAQKGSFAVEDDTSTTGDDQDESADAVNVVTIEATATDASGNPATLTATTYTVTNGVTDRDTVDAAGDIGDGAVTILNADDEEVDTISARVDQKKDSTTAVVISLAADGDEKPDPGEYTVQVTFNDKEATATITVAGDPASVVLESDQAEGSSIITVTATVTDADGNLVPNATKVEFIAVGSLQLTALDADMGVSHRTTKAGVASARYVITGGTGDATVIVDVTDQDGVDAVIVISGPEAEAEVEEEEVISASNCLSSLQQGYASWTCEGSGQASSIFSELQSRGATSLFLWNGSSWARYSVVDGAEVPGSTDFSIGGNDILYISY